MAKKLPLSDALRALNTSSNAAITYQQLWNAAISGKIPAERVGQRWAVSEADLATIASRLSPSHAA
jgi:hypothetical protein